MKSGRRARHAPARRIGRTALGAALAAAAVLGVQATANGASPGAEAVAGAAGTDPSGPYGADSGRGPAGPSEIHKLGLTDQGKGEAVLTRRDTQPFGLLGVSWTDPKAEIKGRIEARTRSIATGEWSAWIELEAHPVGMDGVRPGAPGSTEPVWVGASDGAEVRISDGSATSTLPAGLKLNMVDPGSSGAEAKKSGELNAAPAAFVAADPPTTPPTTPGPSSSAPRPTVVPRAQWGGQAIEDKTPEPPQYLPGGAIKAAFIHHTTSADYSCAQSASVVRGILDYHVDVEKWRDIGYNFLVDKCGTVFEGRKGGVDQPVYGAHTYGWNAESTSVAILGDFTKQAAPDAALAAAGQVAAYKLGQYGVSPTGKATLTAGATQKNFFGDSFTVGQTYAFDAISGHRNGFNTECPGTMLFPQLPKIRTYATGALSGLKIQSLGGGAVSSGSGYETSGPATVNWSTSTASALIDRFDVLVDGTPAATAAGTARSAAVDVAGVGDHKVVVRATYKTGSTTLSAPVTVTVPGPKTFKPLTPTRLMDTRAGLGVAKAKVGPGGEVVLQVAGKGGVPETGVGAVVLNVTATNPTAASFVSVYPNGTVRTSASNLNFTAGKTIPNLVTVPVVDGKVRFYNLAGTVDLIADVTGYYVKDTSGSTYTALAPKRLMDTRAGLGVAKAKVGAGVTVDLQVAGGADVPAGATAVVFNVTATGPTAGGFVSVHPTGTARTSASNLNFVPGQTIPNLVIVPIGKDGKVSFYNKSGNVDLIADAMGYFSADPAGASHVNIGPKRLMDTRAGLGVPKAKVGKGGVVSLAVAGTQGVPAGATAVVLNVTATGPTSGGFVSVYPGGTVRSSASNLNFTAGLTIPNLVIVPVGKDGKVNFYNHLGSVDLLADITGYFVK
ncbi:N-acetylmuramoyl-L-alanine amidase [Streptomyces sp. NPDC090025]|uniref:N-acetylmuramoyl-L-alanine amidase n=1 Tax=Streptomyces sp. NPDC090025 TaxID=3365922 RepID=UPI0038382594